MAEYIERETKMCRGICLDCEYCDAQKTNNLEQIRCTRFSTYVEPLYSCDKFEKKKAYIGRQALLEKLEARLSDCRFMVKYEQKHGSLGDVQENKAKREEIKSLISIVKSQPAADVPVRHGKWDYIALNDCFSCNLCKFDSDVVMNYCGGCGAKMDEE